MYLPNTISNTDNNSNCVGLFIPLSIYQDVLSQPELKERLEKRTYKLQEWVGLSTHGYTLFSTPKGRNHNLIVLPACLGLRGFKAL